MRRVAVATLVLALAGCGGEEVTREPAPVLPAALAERLARDADLVATRLDAADPCGAEAAAERLRTRTLAAVNGPAVPPPLKEELLANVQSLHERTVRACSSAQEPAPPTTVEADDRDDEGEPGENGKGKDKGKGKGKGRGGKGDG